MRVNLNKVAEQIVPEYRHNQFVDNVIDLNLPPLYRGALKTFYPSHIREIKSRRNLRRYIFKYNANGSFDFIATRLGQRNGGNNVKTEDSQINVIITDPSNNFAELRNRNFNIVNENLFTAGNNTRILKANQRFLWQERPNPRTPLFSTIFYSDATTNELQNADKENDVNWFEQTTNKYVIANNTRIEYYNNNTLRGLNSWPIENSIVTVPEYVIQDNLSVGSYSNTLVTETKPFMLDDDYLARCFRDVNLYSYDTVFVEVYWKEYENAPTYWSTNYNEPKWLGEPFTVPVRKGRIYRIGKLAESKGIGEFDVVTFASRTRIKTTRTRRGGDSVFN